MLENQIFKLIFRIIYVNIYSMVIIACLTYAGISFIPFCSHLISRRVFYCQLSFAKLVRRALLTFAHCYAFRGNFYKLWHRTKWRDKLP